jgi:hypothetical protein
MADYLKMTSFLRKKKSEASFHSKLNFFQILKKQSCSSKAQDIAKKIFQDGGCYQNGVCTFSYMQICLVTVILGL